VHLAAGDLPQRLADLPKARPIAMVCASGYRSSVATARVRGAAFTELSWVAEGVPAWRAAGRPVERGEGREAKEPAGQAAGSAGATTDPGHPHSTARRPAAHPMRR